MRASVATVQPLAEVTRVSAGPDPKTDAAPAVLRPAELRNHRRRHIPFLAPQDKPSSRHPPPPAGLPPRPPTPPTTPPRTCHGRRAARGAGALIAQ